MAGWPAFGGVIFATYLSIYLAAVCVQFLIFFFRRSDIHLSQRFPGLLMVALVGNAFITSCLCLRQTSDFMGTSISCSLIKFAEGVGLFAAFPSVSQEQECIIMMILLLALLLILLPLIIHFFNLLMFLLLELL